VTHIFLMDTILDESLLSQVVSRAYRMGSKQRVQVEELVMQDTVEEVIYR
jgi:SNF2 family DNA or RNA helicase